MPSLPQRSVCYAQNFLKSPRLIDLLLDRCNIRSSDLVCEIGPGKGIITERLAQRCGQVVAIEKDPFLAAALQQRFAHAPHVTIHEGDFLQFCLPNTPYKVFANIPFNVTTAIVTKLTTAPCPPQDAYLTMQQEAARKFAGQPRESLYGVLLKPWFEIEIVHHFRRSDFIPEPRVDVVMLRLRKRGPPLINQSDRQKYRDLVVYGFTAWRQTLKDAFKDIFTAREIKRLDKDASIDLSVTPSSLPFEQWLELFEYFKQIKSGQALQVIAGSERRLRKQQEGLDKMHRTRVSGKR